MLLIVHSLLLLLLIAPVLSEADVEVDKDGGDIFKIFHISSEEHNKPFVRAAVVDVAIDVDDEALAAAAAEEEEEEEAIAP